jgi:hypothetical protein
MTISAKSISDFLFKKAIKYSTKQGNKHGKYSSNIGNVTVIAYNFYRSKN